MIHGGGWRSGNKNQMQVLGQEIAAKGYACFAIEYRLSLEAKYPEGIYDVKNAIKFIKDNAKKFHVDPDKIAILGCSSGGQMAALIGTTNNNPIFEDKGFKIKTLLEKYKVNAYVQKGRNSITQLNEAILQLSQSDEVYLSSSVKHVLRDKSTREIDDFDVALIKQLAIGITQDELEQRFKELGITPNSKSAIEKRLSKLKDHFRANNTVHLIAIAKDMGIA